MQADLKEEPISWVFMPHRWPNHIDLEPPFQRQGGVWSETRNQLLVDSLLRGWDIPKFYFRDVGDGENFEVVDGKQRLNAIDLFRRGELKLGKESKTLPKPFGDLSDKSYDDLSDEQKDRFGERKLAIVKLRNAGEEEVRELFLRLQEGVALTPPEKRNAKLGDLRDFVAEVAGSEEDFDPHRVLTRTRYSATRYRWDDLVAIVTCLEIAGGPIDVGAVSLRNLYDKYEALDPPARAATVRVKKVLKYMDKVLEEDTPEMKTKWGFTDLYLLISSLMSENWVLTDREADFRLFFQEFEGKRLAASKPEDRERLAASSNWMDNALSRYILAFTLDGQKEHGIERRHGVFLELVLDQVDDLVRKDHQRFFTEYQRIVLWRRAGMKCQNPECEDPDLPVFNANVQGDHIDPWINGGPTSLDNGQCLCGPCNAAKGAQ
jgi:hypothetical protein